LEQLKKIEGWLRDVVPEKAAHDDTRCRKALKWHAISLTREVREDFPAFKRLYIVSSTHSQWCFNKLLMVRNS